MKTGKRVLAEVMVAVSAILIVTACLLPRGSLNSLHRLPSWFWDGAKLRLSLRQDASADFHDRTASGPLPFAAIVSDMHRAWPAANYSVVHESALEVATDLLHRGDIEMGEKIGGVFQPLQLPPWAARGKLQSELRFARDFFQDSDRFVFRRK